MKEYIITVQKLLIASADYAETPSDKNYFKVLDLTAIVEFMSDHLIKQLEIDEKSYPQEICLN